MTHSRLSHNRRAFTLTELALVMAVIGMIMGAVWWAASNAKETQRENDAVSELQNVTQGMMNLMAGQSFSVATPANITAPMIVAQAIPSSYVNVQTGVTADNPWSPQNLYVYATGAKTFQIWFYNVSYQGCLTLLLQGTACQAGQEGCPTAIYTAGGGGGNMCQPNQSNCPNSSPTYNATNIGWQVATPTIVNTMCGANNYHGGTNSVIFQYTL